VIKIKGKENVKKQIFLVLIKNKKPITVSMLAKEISMSGKTVRNYLKILQSELDEKEIKLIIKPNVGVYLDVTEEERKLLNMGIHISSNEEEKYSPEHRRSYILKTLLKNKYSYTLQLFAEDLYCSKTTIINDLVYIQSWLEKRGLQLKRKQNQGLWVEGNEKNYRRAMMDLFLEINGNEEIEVEQELDQLDYRIDFINYKKVKELFPFVDLFKIQEIIQQAEKKLGYYFTDQAFINLIIHIAIAIERIKNEKEIKMIKKHFESLKDKYEFEVATWVVKRLSEAFHLFFSEDEIGYISLHMLGAKIQEDIDTNNCDMVLDVQNREYIHIAKEIISLAGDVLNIDLSHDQQLLIALVLHLRPTVVRLKYGLKLRNPILQTIKNEYTSIFGAAWACSSIFEKKLGVSINEDEVGYIAMHLAVGVGRLNQKVKTIIVCSSGVGTSQLISTRLQERFHKIEVVSIIPLSSLNDEIIEKSDLIISTIPGIIDSNKVVYVSTILDATDVLKIKSVLGKLEGKSNKEDIQDDFKNASIKKIIDEELCFIDDQKNDFIEIVNHYGRIMEERGYVKKGFCENVLEREKIGSTIIGKGIAIPHSKQEFVNKSKICIVKLKKPITWDGQKVRLIILLAFNQKDLNTTKAFYKKFYSILNDKNFIYEMMTSDNKSEIINIFLNGGN
jgi:transcriptional antiterminator